MEDDIYLLLLRVIATDYCYSPQLRFLFAMPLYLFFKLKFILPFIVFFIDWWTFYEELNIGICKTIVLPMDFYGLRH
jgi:hypothetical protein